MKNNIYAVFLALVISICVLSDISATGRQKRKEADKYKTLACYPARSIPDSIAFPEDTTQYSIRMKGQRNTITMNGKKVIATTDTTEKQNSIRVIGMGNKISINQPDQKSKANITQQGKNNRIQISQHK